MTLSPVKTTKTYEAITDQLKHQIVTGAFPPGSRLPSVRELGEQLSVSQPVVREALTALKAMKLISMRQGDGTFVNQYDPHEMTQAMDTWDLMRAEDIAALLELRKILETSIAALAAQRRTDEDAAALLAILATMEQETTSSALGEQTDWALHYAIARAARNAFLVSMLDGIGERIQRAVLVSRQALYKQPGQAERLLLQHRAIVEAIVSGNAPGAQANMLLHLSYVEAALRLKDAHQAEKQPPLKEDEFVAGIPVHHLPGR